MSAVKNAKRRKRRSQAPVALVYFITVLVFLALFAVLGIYLLKNFGIIGDKNDDTPVTTSTAFTNLYARVNSKGVLSDLTVVRIDPDNSKILVVPMSALTVSETQKTKTFREIFEDGGIGKLNSAVTDTFGIEIDSYMTVTNSAFERIADIFGGITYTAPEELYYLSQDNDENDIFLSKGELESLSGRQIRLICQYPVFSSGKQGNMEFLGIAVTQLVNNAFQQASLTIDNMDNIYNVMTSNSDTNFGSDEYRIQKAYIKDMLSTHSTSAEQLCPEGQWTDDKHFEVSPEFRSKLNNAFSGKAVDEDSSEE